GVHAAGFRVQSRALPNTLFARLFLTDLFLHGIGGGKYDELTDEIIRRFFGFQPPRFPVVTPTRRLPIVRPPTVQETPEALEHRLWNLTHHPEEFIDAARLADGES